jgi:hypothetical protein
VERPEHGKTTLEWCTPPHGLDLLRVYLITDGQSPIFRNMTSQELMGKLRDKDGQDTLASKLYQGLIEPEEANNDAVEYIKRELIWLQ